MKKLFLLLIMVVLMCSVAVAEQQYAVPIGDYSSYTNPTIFINGSINPTHATLENNGTHWIFTVNDNDTFQIKNNYGNLSLVRAFGDIEYQQNVYSPYNLLTLSSFISTSQNKISVLSAFDPGLNVPAKLTFNNVDLTPSKTKIFRNGLLYDLPLTWNGNDVEVTVPGFSEWELGETEFNGTLNNMTIFGGNLTIDADAVGIWFFDGTEFGNDSSLYGNDGTVNDAIFNATGGHNGNGAYQFDGINDNITIADDDSLDLNGSFSISVWFKPAIIPQNAWSGIITKYDGSTDYNYIVQVNSSSNSIMFGFDTGTVIISNPVLTLDTWTHGVFNFDTDNDNLSIYFNGVLDSSQTETAEPSIDAEDISIGKQQGGALRWWNGSIDDVQIFNRSLTSTEILDIYNGTQSKYRHRSIGNYTSIKHNITEVTGQNISQNNFCKYIDFIGDTYNMTVYIRNASTRAGLDSSTWTTTNQSNNRFTLVNPLANCDHFQWYTEAFSNHSNALNLFNYSFVGNNNTRANVTITNISTNLGTNTTDENITVFFTGEDGDGDDFKNITDWRLNGNSIAVLNMPFEGGSTSTVTLDYSSLKNDGTPVLDGSGTFNSTAGYDGFGAYQLDGINDHIFVNDNDYTDNGNSLSVFAWVKPVSNSDQHVILAKWDYNTNGSWYYEVNADGTIDAYIANETTDGGSHGVTTSGTINTNEWSYVGFVYNGSGSNNSNRLKVYINSIEQGVSTIGTIPLNLTDSNATIKIGKFGGIIDRYFNGTLDDVLIFNRSLSEEQIKLLYENRTDLIVSQETSLGEQWSACITPNDGIEDGLEVCSANLTIISAENPPVVSNVVLNSTSLLNTSSENLTVYHDVTDADGDNVTNITDWRRDGVSWTMLHMPMENHPDATNVSIDYSTWGTNGTTSTATWNAVGGHDGRGYYEFDGKDDQIAIGTRVINPLTTYGVTLAFWYKLNEPSVSEVATIMGGLNNLYRDIYFITGNLLTVESDTNDQFCQTNQFVEDGNWHFAIINMSNGRCTFFQDDVEKTANDATIPNVITVTKIGKTQTAASLNGSIGSFMIFNRSLSREQMTLLYNNRSDLLVSEETSVGEQWMACITPNDGTEDGATVCSSNLTINTKPVVSNVILNSTSLLNTSSENLTIHFTVTDTDAVRNITDWRINGTSIAVLNMPFEQHLSSSTTAIDYSTYSNNGTFVNATFNSTGGYDGFGAYQFGGKSNYIYIDGVLTEINTTTTGTITSWIKLNEVGSAADAIIGFGDSNANERLLFFVSAGGNLRASIVDAGSDMWNLGTTGTLNVDTWYHVAVIQDGTQPTLYLDGDAVAQSFTGADADRTRWLDDLTGVDNGRIGMGNFNNANTSDFNGTIDNVIIFNRSLSAAQIKALYNNRTDLIVSNETNLGEDWSACITPNDGKEDGTQVCSNNLTIIPPLSCGDTITKDTNLTEDLNCEGTGIIFGAENITLNCNNYIINYGSGGTGYGVDMLKSNTIVRNCIISETNTAGANKHAIRVNATNTTIYNNTITTIDTSSDGISDWTVDLDWANITLNRINTSGATAAGIDIDGDYNIMNNNNFNSSFIGISSEGSQSKINYNTVYMNRSDVASGIITGNNGLVVGNNVTVWGTSSPVGIFVDSGRGNVNITNNTIVIGSANEEGLSINSGNNNNRIIGNTITGTGDLNVFTLNGNTNYVENNIVTRVAGGGDTSNVLALGGIGNILVNNNISSSISNNKFVISHSGSSFNKIIYNNSFGQIIWNNTNLDANITLQIGTSIFLEDNLTGLIDNSTVLNLNSSASIEIRGLSFSNRPVLLKDGIRCDHQAICNITNYDSGTGLLQAVVATFSNYSASENVVPNVTTPLISPDPAYFNTSLTVNTTFTDQNNDTGNVTFMWTVNGTLVYTQTNLSILNGTQIFSTLFNGNFTAHNLVNVSVFATDGVTTSINVSDDINITNFNPTLNNVILNSSSLTNTTDENLNCYGNITEPEGFVDVNFTWYNNTVEHLSGQTTNIGDGISLISTLNFGNTSINENWTCSLIAFDGINFTDTVNSTPLTIIYFIDFPLNVTFEVGFEWIKLSWTSPNTSNFTGAPLTFGGGSGLGLGNGGTGPGVSILNNSHEHNASNITAGTFSGDFSFDSNLDLGNNDINNINVLHFNLTPVHEHEEGSIHWDDDHKTLLIDLNVLDVHLPVGQAMLLYGRNNLGYQINKSQVVYITGGLGGKPTLGLAQANSEATSSSTIAMAAHNCTDNSNCYFVTSGEIFNVSTSAYSAGDMLYLSPETPGGLTTTKPNAPNHSVVIGTVLRSNVNSGVINIRIQNGFEMHELHDVDNASNFEGNLLSWNLANQRYELGYNVNLSGGNLTLGDKITFKFGEIIDNIIDGWLRFTGNTIVVGDLNVTGNTTLNTPVGEMFLGESGNIHLATEINTTEGEVDSGDITSVQEIDMVYYAVSESGKWNITYNFTDLDGDPGQFEFVGRYEGSTAHNVFVYALNYSNDDYVRLTTASEDFDSSDEDASFTFNFPLNSSEFRNGKNASIRIYHESSSNPTHDFYTDYVALTTKDFIFQQQGIFYNFSGFDEGIERNIIVNASEGFFNITVPGFYRYQVASSFSGSPNTIYNGHIFVNNVIVNKSGIRRAIGSGGDVGNVGTTGILNLNKHDKVELRIMSESGQTFVSVDHYNFNLMKIN